MTMDKKDNYVNRSIQIDRYINNEMQEEERSKFEALLNKDLQLLEAVDFAKKIKLTVAFQQDINIARFLNAFDDTIPLHKESKGLDEMNRLAYQIQQEMMISEILQFKN